MTLRVGRSEAVWIAAGFRFGGVTGKSNWVETLSRDDP